MVEIYDANEILAFKLAIFILKNAFYLKVVNQIMILLDDAYSLVYTEMIRQEKMLKPTSWACGRFLILRKIFG